MCIDILINLHAYEHHICVIKKQKIVLTNKSISVCYKTLLLLNTKRQSSPTIKKNCCKK